MPCLSDPILWLNSFIIPMSLGSSNTRVFSTANRWQVQTPYGEPNKQKIRFLKVYSILNTTFNFMQVAMTHPMAMTNCNIDMESLISDQNRSVATLAITTLLKTGNESSVDRLMKQITNFMSDIADEFKIVVVEAIRSLCLKFPLKYRSM